MKFSVAGTHLSDMWIVQMSRKHFVTNEKDFLLVFLSIQSGYIRHFHIPWKVLEMIIKTYTIIDISIGLQKTNVVF